jgi:hypothetical protein
VIEERLKNVSASLGRWRDSPSTVELNCEPIGGVVLTQIRHEPSIAVMTLPMNCRGSSKLNFVIADVCDDRGCPSSGFLGQQAA